MTDEKGKILKSEIVKLPDKSKPYSSMILKLESEEISKRIKDVKGISYDDDSGVLTVKKEMTEKRFRESLLDASN